MRIKTGALILAVSLLSGCGEKTYEGLSYGELPSEAVLARVNGEAYTKGEIERDIGIQMSLLAVVRPNLPDSQVEKHYRRIADSAIANFVQRQIWLGEAKRRGLSVTGAEVETLKAKFLLSLSKRKPIDKTGLARLLGPEKLAVLLADIAKDALVLKVRKAVREECDRSVSDADLADIRSAAQRYNARAAATNAVIHASATNLWKAVKAGTDFATAGKKAAEMYGHVTFNDSWGPFAAGELSDSPKLVALLGSMKPGDVTPPIEGDNGLMLVKLAEVVKPNFTDSTAPKYRFEQIFFALPEFCDIPEGDAGKAKLAKEKGDKAFEDYGNGLKVKADIFYLRGERPLGKRAGSARKGVK